MQSVHISKISVGENRQRKVFNEEELVSLSKSIQSLGLLHPVIVRETEDGIILVAGERRMRAMQMLIDLDIPISHENTAFLKGMIPVTLLRDLDEVDAYEAELEENASRTDLTWQEKAEAIKQLHDLRGKQKFLRGEGTQSVRETVKEVIGADFNNNDFTLVSENLIVADHLDDPEVAKATSRKQAMKIVEKKAKQKQREMLAEHFNLKETKHTLVQGDALIELLKIEDESIDCIVTDPPYGMGANAFGDNFATSHKYEDTWEYFTEIAKTLASDFFRILKPHSHCYVFCTFEGYLYLRQEFLAAGFRIWPHPMIWAKGNGNAPWINMGHKKSYECIMFAVKGQREVNTVKTDVLLYSPVSDRDHAAEKPTAIYVDLINRSANPGDIVLDPFAGSGTIFSACNETKTIGYGIELSPAYYALCVDRLKEE